MLTLALDIGGTKIAVGLTDPAGELVHKAVEPTPKDQEAEHVWGLVDRMIVDATNVAQGAIQAVGIGSAGPIDAVAGTVSPVNIASWRGFPLRDRIAAAMPGVPVRLAGDGICMALAEHWRGAGRGANFLLGMVVSTGVGGGLVLDGVPYHGTHRQRRSRRPRRRRTRRAVVPLRWTRLRRDRRVRTVDDAVGAGQRVGGAARRRRRDAG